MATTITTILSTVAARPPGMGGLALTRVARAVGTRAASRRVSGGLGRGSGGGGAHGLGTLGCNFLAQLNHRQGVVA